jgi:SAM-dependent methyltransferase
LSAHRPLADKLAEASGRPAQWSAVASGWSRQRSYVWDVSREVAERMVEALAPRPGETILELAAGPGDTGFAAADKLGPQGVLVSTDVAPEMVAAAKARGRELGLSNVEYRVVDAQAIDLPDGHVDGVLCRWGYMLVPDPAKALAETFRVLRPGGRVVLTVWAEPDVNPWGTAVGRALLELDLIDRPAPDAPGPFRLGDVDRLRRLVRSAGFDDPVVEDVPVTWRHDSFDHYWDVTADLSFLLTTAQETLTADVLADVRAITARELQTYTSDDGRLAVPGLCRIARAQRPGGTSA